MENLTSQTLVQAPEEAEFSAPAKSDDSSLKPLLKELKKIFREEVRPAVGKRGRHTFFSRPRRPKSRRGLVPEPPSSELAEVVFEEIRRESDISITVRGVKELPEGQEIKGSVLILRVEETGEIFLCEDRQKQKRGFLGKSFGRVRWGFPGGGREDGESVSRNLLRETREELHLNGMNFVYTFIGLIPLLVYDEDGNRYQTQDAKTALFFAEIPSRIAEKARKGVEQEEIKRAKEEVITEMIEAGEFLPNHVNYEAAYRFAKMLGTITKPRV